MLHEKGKHLNSCLLNYMISVIATWISVITIHMYVYNIFYEHLRMW